jgi:hypothetical protein
LIFSATCTHQACTITGFQNQSYVCPCHLSTFDLNGRVQVGPAVAPLPQYPSQVSYGAWCSLEADRERQAGEARQRGMRHDVEDAGHWLTWLVVSKRARTLRVKAALPPLNSTSRRKRVNLRQSRNAFSD